MWQNSMIFKRYFIAKKISHFFRQLSLLPHARYYMALRTFFTRLKIYKKQSRKSGLFFYILFFNSKARPNAAVSHAQNPSG